MSEWLENVRSNAESYDDGGSLDILRALVAAYDLLVPPIDMWPDDMKFFTIDASGEGCWHLIDPEPDLKWAQWISDGEEEAGAYVLELGIDWRLCKWPRPKADDHE